MHFGELTHATRVREPAGLVQTNAKQEAVVVFQLRVVKKSRWIWRSLEFILTTCEAKHRAVG
jgi:hypothetical protein